MIWEKYLANKLSLCPLIGPMLVQLTCCQALFCPLVRSIICPSLRETMESYIHNSLAAGIIRSSSLPLGAVFFFVSKKDKTLRPCIDLCDLNNITIENKYPLPLISAAFSMVPLFSQSWISGMPFILSRSRRMMSGRQPLTSL